MREILTLKTKDLITEYAKIVRTECPIAHMLFNKNFEFEKHCLGCDWYVEGDECGWYVYKTNLVKEHVEYDDNNDGTLPFDDYYKYIECWNCGSEIKHHSGYSWFIFGDVIQCNKCKVKHMYLGSNKNILKFGIPYKQVQDNGI